MISGRRWFSFLCWFLLGLLLGRRSRGALAASGAAVCIQLKNGFSKNAFSKNALSKNAFFENAFWKNAFFENFANFWRARSRLYQNEFCKKICVRQHISSSTRFAYFCTAAISKFSQKIGLKKQQFS